MHKHAEEYEKNARLAKEMGIVSEQEWRKSASKVVDPIHLAIAVFSAAAALAVMATVISSYFQN